MEKTTNIIPVVEETKRIIAEKITHESESPFFKNGVEALVNTIMTLKYFVVADGLTYSEMPEIMGTYTDLPFEELRNLAYTPWTEESGLTMVSSPMLTEEDVNAKAYTMLDVVCYNIYAYELRAQKCTLEDLKKPFVLREWENYNLIPDKDRTEILREVSKL